MQPILEVRQISKRFGAVTALDAVSAAFGRGEFVCILGPSGCGKSTLLRLIAGFDAPDSGDILLDGANVSGVQPEKRPVNMVFQNYALFPHLTVGENVAFGLKLKKLDSSAIGSRVQQALEMVHLAGLEQRYPGQLSGGQQQRVALARAIVNQPKVLLLDEPLAALDKNLRLAMQSELRSIQRELGITFLHVTHDQSEALTLADRVMIMRDGVIEQVGEPQEVYNRPRNRFIAEFLGSSNVFVGNWDADARSLTFPNGLRIRAENDTLPPQTAENAEFMIRPERVDILPGASSNHHENSLDARIEQIVYAGAETHCLLSLEGQPLTVQLLSRDPHSFRPGETVTVHIPPRHLVYLSGRNDPSLFDSAQSDFCCDAQSDYRCHAERSRSK